MQWKNPDGSITEGVVIEDGGGNKISSFGGGSGSGGAVTVADGANVAQGSTTDSAGASTIMGQIKSAAASLAAILAKLIAGIPVTGVFWQATQPVSGVVTANIGTTNGLALDASLQAILAALTAQIDISGSLWADPTVNPPVYYVRREAIAEATGVVTVSWWTPGGVSASPNVANLVSVSNAKNIAQETVVYTATVAGTGYAAGDILIHAFGIDTAAATPVLAYSIWMNAGPSASSGSILASAPASGTYAQAIQQVSAAALPLPANAAQETGGNLAAAATTLAAILAKQPAAPALASNQPAINADGGGQSHVMNFPATQVVSFSGQSVGITGSAGADYSANQPAVPIVGANFAASGPYASYVLVKTIPALATRNSIDIENTSGSQIVIIRDDGTASSGSAPVNASVFPLAAGFTGVGSQGGGWASQTFKGRVQIYAPASTAQVAAFVD